MESKAHRVNTESETGNTNKALESLLIFTVSLRLSVQKLSQERN